MLHGVSRLWLVLACAVLAVSSVPPASAQTFPVITRDNVKQVQPVARLGKGHVDHAFWLPDGHRYAVVSTGGVWIYDVRDEMVEIKLTDEVAQFPGLERLPLTSDDLAAQLARGNPGSDKSHPHLALTGSNHRALVTFAANATRATIWNLDSLARVGEWRVSAPDRQLTALFSPDERTVALLEMEHDRPVYFRLLNSATGRLVYACDTTDTCGSVTFSPDSRLAGAWSERSYHVIDIAGSKVIRSGVRCLPTADDTPPRWTRRIGGLSFNADSSDLILWCNLWYKGDPNEIDADPVRHISFASINMVTGSVIERKLAGPIEILAVRAVAANRLLVYGVDQWSGVHWTKQAFLYLLEGGDLSTVLAYPLDIRTG